MFALRKDAQKLTIDEVKGKLKTLTQGQKSDNIINLMANTFKALCDIADWSNSVPLQLPTTDISTDTAIPKAESRNTQEQSMEGTSGNSNKMSLHYNIQIHLPETTNMAVYDAIFQSLKKHLM